MFLPTPTITDITDAIGVLAPKKNEVISMYIGEKTPIDYDALITVLNQLEVRFFGGVFPGVINGTSHYDSGVIIQKHLSSNEIFVIKDLKQKSYDFIKTSLARQASPPKTAMVLLDGLSADIAVFLSDLYDSLGNIVDCIGGGAGSLSLQQQPCLITNEGLLEDAAVICVIDTPILLSVKHGWKKLKGPFIATKTEKNTIYELNWQNAFEVYKEVVDEDSGLSIGQDNFFEIAKNYPFGMAVAGEEAIVRDPIMVGDDGELVCVGEVSNNTVLEILKGETDKLIASAENAALYVMEEMNNRPIQSVFIVDCISRTLFLQDAFDQELKILKENLLDSGKTDFSLTGILSLGEISSKGSSPIYFYNKTLVLGAFY